MTDHQIPGPPPNPGAGFPDARDADAQLAALLRAARDHYRVPRAEPPLDAMWAAVERETFGAPVQGTRDLTTPFGARRGLHSSRTVSTQAMRAHALWPALAAALVFGVVLGRTTAGSGSAGVVASAANAPGEGEDPAQVAAEPVDAETARYLTQTAALLIALPVGLPAETRASSFDAGFNARAQQLLGTTRVLLDGETDPATRTLLEDLELVLAQIVGVRAGNRTQEMELINQALEQRALLVRLQAAASGGALHGAD